MTERGNILTYGLSKHTPDLDSQVFDQIIQMQNDRFVSSQAWKLALREMLIASVLQADIVGCLGIWRPQKAPSVEVFVQKLRKDPRGFSGHWRAMSLMHSLASKGIFNEKIVAPAHLYFSIASHLHEIIQASSKVLLITSHKVFFETLVDKYQDKEFDLIEVGLQVEDTGNPIFLERVHQCFK